ncbi:MAG: hypothetical protein ACI923_000364 [Flavobacteriales bacterium]
MGEGGPGTGCALSIKVGEYFLTCFTRIGSWAIPLRTNKSMNADKNKKQKINGNKIPSYLTTITET